MNSRLLSLITALMLALAGAHATVYTVDNVPDVQRADSTRFVSDPDGILSPSARQRIDSTLLSLRRRTTAQVAVVMLDSIDTDDDSGFATALFDKWKVGQSDVDNGLIILVVPSLHAAQIRTGYGLEGVLPDAVCNRILRGIMFPAFRENDYDAGVLGAVAAVDNILSDPDNREEILSQMATPAGRRDDSGSLGEFLASWCGVGALLGLFLLGVFLFRLSRCRRQSDHAKYLTFVKMKPWYLIATFVFLGTPLIGSLPLLVCLNRWRNGRHKCPHCGTPMSKLDEVSDNAFLNPGQDLEEKLGSVDYDVWLCPQCGETDILPYVDSSSRFKECPRCHVHAYSLERQRVVRPASSGRAGQGVSEWRCKACGYGHDEPFRIEPDADGAVVAGAVLGSILGSGRGGGGGFGGGFGGGGFGGGMTGGGGAGGRW